MMAGARTLVVQGLAASCLLGLNAASDAVADEHVGGNVSGSCNVVGDANHISCTIVDRVIEGLDPETRSELVRILPKRTAQRRILAGVVKATDKLGELAVGQRKGNRDRQEMKAMLEALVADKVDPELKDWIQRAKELESMLTGPNLAAAREHLKQGRLDEAQKALEDSLEAQNTSRSSLQAEMQSLGTALL